MGYVKGTKEKSSPRPKLKQLEQANQVILDYNPSTK